MRVHGKLAKTRKEFEGLFQVRHKVFIEEDGKFPSQPDKRLYDYFDIMPTNVNVIAMVNDKVIGCLRMTERSEIGLPADRFFDFRPYLPKSVEKLGSASMFALLSEYRNNMQLIYMLLSIGCYWCISRNITHIITPINPEISPLLAREGFTPLCGKVESNVGGLEIIPMMLQISELRDTSLQYVKRVKLEKQIDITPKRHHNSTFKFRENPRGNIIEELNTPPLALAV